MGLVLILLSGLAAGAFSLGYKIAGRRGYPYEPLLAAFALVIALVSLAMTFLTGASLKDTPTFVLGSLMGSFMLLAIMLYFHVTKTARHNVSWTILQFNVLIPFIVSIVAYGERPGLFAVLGTVCSLGSILLFGMGRPRRSQGKAPVPPSCPPGQAGGENQQENCAPEPDKGTQIGNSPAIKVGLALALSTILSGLSATVAPVYRHIRPQGSLPPLMFAAGLSMSVIALAWAWIKGRWAFGHSARCDNSSATIPKKSGVLGMLALAVYMGVLNMTAFGLLLAGLHSLPGTIAFPARNAVNILAVFFLSYFLFGERASRYELAGAAAAIAGIALISSGR